VKIPSRAFLALLIFLATLAIYVKSQVTSRGDTLWSLYVAASILKEGNTDLDEYAHLMSPDDYRLERVGSHIYSRFSVGAPFIAVPFVAIAENLAHQRHADRREGSHGLAGRERQAGHRPGHGPGRAGADCGQAVQRVSGLFSQAEASSGKRGTPSR